MHETITEQSWLERLGESARGMILGGILFLAAVPVLFWNEGRAVKTAKGLAEGADAVVRVDADSVEPDNNAKLVHTSGTATSSQVLRDETFGIEIPGIRLARHVEMYQWKERIQEKTKKKLGGGTRTVTTYSYEKIWSPKLINSSAFSQSSAHQNPSLMEFQPHATDSTDVKLGAFELPLSLVKQIRNPHAISISNEQLPDSLAERAKIMNDGPDGGQRLYLSASDSDGAGDQIGDLRVWFTHTPDTEISVMARQTENSFEPYPTAAGTQLQLLANEITSPEQMISQAEAANNAMTWALRLGGLLMAIGGVALLLRPLSVLADVLPFLGSMVEFGTTLAAGLIGGGVSLCTISVAWLFYRPLIGLPMLALGLVLLIGLVYSTLRRSQKPSNDAPSAQGIASFDAA